jgi:MutS domain V
MTEPGWDDSIDSGGPRKNYARRLAERTRERERWSYWDRRLADLRLAAFLGILIGAVWLYRGGRAASAWLGASVGLFVILVMVHEPVRRRGDRARRAVEFYERGLARVEGRWAGTGIAGLDYLDVEHPYAADLDLFGRGSMFERLCTARTRSGEAVLAAWLLEPTGPDSIAERHEAVDELRPRLDWREDLELLGSEVRAGIDPEALSAWCAAPRALDRRAIPIAAVVLGIIGTAATIGWLFLGTGLLPLLAVVVIDLAFNAAVSRRVRSVLADVDQRAHDLMLLSELLRRLEREPFRAPLLQRLRAAMEVEGTLASTRIRRLARLLHLLDTQRNQLFAPIAALWHWRILLAIRIDAWRGAAGPEVARWILAVGEVEALGALAAYAAENPDDPFPEVVPGEALYQAESLGHPLIPTDICVRNDLALGPDVRLLIVSGSNMSGKSTLLRTVGINAVLAFAGAPVRARRLKVSPLRIGATLRIQDSLQEGRSRFYAEITRVRQIVGLARGPIPLLFLFDELFHGTNSHDRTVGAEGVLRGLIDSGAIGLVTTHDLSLARIADTLAPRARNVHFEDQLIDGRMHFDYRMRPGVVQHSNALALMRAVGLEV